MAILVAVSSRALAHARALGGAERCQGENGAPTDAMCAVRVDRVSGGTIVLTVVV